MTREVSDKKRLTVKNNDGGHETDTNTSNETTRDDETKAMSVASLDNAAYDVDEASDNDRWAATWEDKRWAICIYYI
jgi:hypothetical protein